MPPRKQKNKVNPTKRKDVAKIPWFLMASGKSIDAQVEAATSGVPTPTNTTDSSSTFDDASECCHLSLEVIRFLTPDLVSEHIKGEAKMYGRINNNNESDSYPYVSCLRNMKESVSYTDNERSNVEAKGDNNAQEDYEPSSSRKKSNSIIILSSDDEDIDA
ncbi:hypothetical protein CFC21_082916 [Triticum aestivum]|uniref:Uncharacterized protein n=2 Tax=Triticum aestivum TaxID=4565 RepID=A0A9R1L5K1_WHEAT|nr:hypothetical protein CFC21_082916 [Triticum aestivum]